MQEVPVKSYQARIDRVCDFILQHLEEPLSVERLSQVANFSKYHFHRQFAANTGVNVGRYVQLMRLKRASYQLVFNRDMQVIQIALEAGFDNPESFSRAFKSTFGQTPSQFRKAPDWRAWHQEYNYPEKGRNKRMNPNIEVKIVDFTETKVAVLEHHGSHELLNNSVMQFIEWRKSSRLSPVDTSRSFGIPNGDPKAMAAEDFQFDICGSVNADVPENPQGVINKTIPAGRCAMLRHLGSRGEKMDAKIYRLYRDWLPQSGEELRDFPVYFEFINLFPEVPEHQLITDIYLPLK